MDQKKPNELAERVMLMENRYNRCAEITESLWDALRLWEAEVQEFWKLMEYYESEEWSADRAASDVGLLPAEQPCGVLSEDAIYNLFCDMRGVSLDMAEAALRWLRREE